MKTYRQLVYMVLDELGLTTDDSRFTLDHVLFLLNTHRAEILKQKYSDIRKQIPVANYQTICLELEECTSIPGIPCEGTYMRSIAKIPNTMLIKNPRVHSVDYFKGDISYVSQDRFRYVGNNKYLQDIIYSTIGPDNKLYLKSNNPQLYYMEEINITGIFEDSIDALKAGCGNSEFCDLLDKDFPLEESLINILIQIVVQELNNSIYKPEDKSNDGEDDLSDLASFIRRNIKSELQKQITQ